MWAKCADVSLAAPEELSLLDALGALPIPIARAGESDGALKALWARVIKSLNERYGLLRSLGLAPDEWHEREGLSIKDLRELARLKGDASARIRRGETDSMEVACAASFARRVCGYDSFEALRASLLGQALFGHKPISFEAMVQQEPESRAHIQGRSVDTFAEDGDLYDLDARANESQQLIGLVRQRAELFTPVTAYAFEQIISKQRPFFTENDETGVLDDLELRRLLKGEASYRGLRKRQLAQRLWTDLDTIITAARRRLDAPVGEQQ